MFGKLLLISCSILALLAMLAQWYLEDALGASQQHHIASQRNLDALSACSSFIDFNLSSSNGLKEDINEILRDEKHLPYECLFATDYYEARALFRHFFEKLESSLSHRYKVTHDFYPIFPGNKDLGNDVVTIHGNPNKFLFHISGTHGPEGFAGSAIQSTILQYLIEAYGDESRDDRNRLPTIVFIHALNAFGFANNRRVNEDNIDLNRNFLTSEEFEFVKQRNPNFAGYTDIDSYINPTKKPFKSIRLNDLHSTVVSIVAMLHQGQAKLKKGLVSGNYFKQEGLGFGGFKRSKSANNLISIIEHSRVNSLAKEVVLIDVHTGLGEPGEDTLMIDFSNQNMDELSQFYPSSRGGNFENIKGGLPGSVASGYELTVGTLTEDFCTKWLLPRSNSNRLCIAQEFGTKNTMIVGKTLMDENYAFHHGTSEEVTLYGKRLRESFYLSTSNNWKKNVAIRGLVVFLQSVQRLQVS